MKVITWNVKGLRSPNKNDKMYHPDIVFLQESHLSESHFHRMNKLWVDQVYGSPAIQGKVGVLTLIHKNFSHSDILHENYQEGRVSIDKVLCDGTEITLYNVYGPTGDNT